MLFCKECGKNPTHATVDCYKIKNRLKREANNKKAGANVPFSKRTFRKEVNALAVTAKKHGVLELYASTVTCAQARHLKKIAEKKN